MFKKKKKTEEEPGFDIDLGAGKLNLGGVFKGISNLIDLAAKLQREGKSEISRSGEISGLGSKGAKAVYGFSIKLGGLAGESPQVETFGNIKKDEKGTAVVDEVREPLVDLFDETDKVVIIAEIPGVAEREIKISLEKNTLIIRINSPSWKPEHKVALPYAPKGKLEKVFRKGILEIKVGKD